MEYAPFIIAAYIITALVLVGIGIRSYLLLHRHRKELNALQQEDVSKEQD